MKDILPFRQVHLDFHTSELIDNIGGDFNKKEFIDTLKEGHVDSITVFAKCHHGWSYYPSKVNAPHPNLKIDLLGQQLEALKEAGIRAPVYISVGFDEKAVWQHPEWLNRPAPDRSQDLMNGVHFHTLCVNTPYLDEVCRQIEEVMQMYNPDELFFDICDERICYCPTCIKGMQAEGLDPFKEEDAKKYAKKVYAKYCKRIEDTIRKYSKTTAIFHNAGNIPMGREDFYGWDSHLELESLPTGGWGYDHFPMSAAYCRTTGREYMGMTGKFHTTWGEFGGFKHPNALRYETALSVALGAKCSIGDQLHPSGKLNRSTYRLIGAAYKEIEEKEAWCRDVEAVSDVAILSAASTQVEVPRTHLSDIGASRILLEGNYLFDIIDKKADFEKYKLLVLPDCVIADKEISEKLGAFVKNGGKLLVSGESCRDAVPGIKINGAKEFTPSYMRPVDETKFTNGKTEYVMYNDAFEFEADESFKPVAEYVRPYFNRAWNHYTSHQHAPDVPGAGETGVVISENIGYISWKIFNDYARYGELHCRELVINMLEELIGKEKTLTVKGLPIKGVVTLQEQKNENRIINHILFTHTSVRGKGVEFIDDIIPVYGINVEIKLDKAPKSVKFVPAGNEIDYKFENGVLKYRIDKLEMHAMVEIQF